MRQQMKKSRIISELPWVRKDIDSSEKKDISGPEQYPMTISKFGGITIQKGVMNTTDIEQQPLDVEGYTTVTKLSIRSIISDRAITQKGSE
ncbi:hypothetical protein T265_07167 [Opisthorchis viverrini]|uniref:Uncharacterized protein n=1 Tax=Opisthorchis viverrini TaxID=6198 RepID=A0A074ZHW8_OPIVI|nr:hypothetical protein T265_07167 [Opisthorchis viverrini]KER25367.1 hypothetical protein T265_07167 [Opisthorchis viverrini]